MKTLIVHTVALAVGAALAWSVAGDEKKKGASDDQEVVIVDGKALARATLTTPGGTAVVEPRAKDSGRLPAVRLTREVVDETVAKKPSEDAQKADAGVDDVALPMVERTFVFPGGSTVTRALEGLLPLKARRVLSDVGADRLPAMGLAEPKSTLTLVVDGKEHVFDVGEKTYGNTARYVRRRGESDVLLIDNNALSGIEGTETKLSERRLVTVAPEKILTVAIARDGKERVFAHQERDQANKRFFAPRETPDEKSDEADAVVSTLRKLRAREYVEERPSEPPVVQLRVEREGGAPVAIALWGVVDGTAFVQVDEWTARITESQAKDLDDDTRAALP